MDFNICSSDNVTADSILVTPALARELGIVEGQFLQLQGQENIILSIKISKNVPVDTCEPLTSWVHPSVLPKLDATRSPAKVLEITVGCDPEYFILQGRSVINAHSYLPFQGEIGCDGTLAELRPHYGQTEQEVVGNLTKLIPQIASRMQANKWAANMVPSSKNFHFEAHSYYGGFPAGFHVHLGLPPEILNTRVEFNRTTLNHLVRCLDWYVSVPLLPLEVAHERRLGKGKYGKPGDYRPSAVTLEYRTPGGFYLRTPELARGLLGLCLAVTEELVYKVKEASNNYSQLTKLTPKDLNDLVPIPNAEKILTVLSTKIPETARGFLDSIYNSYKDLTTFSRHQASIEKFFRAVDSGKRPSPDLVENWKERL